MANLLSSLHPLERKLLPHLKDNASLDELVKSSGMQEVEVMRALQWLENKGVLKINLNVKEVVELDTNGEKYKEKGLPEIRLLKELKNGDKKISDLSLDKDEINISIGALKKKAAINISKDGNELKLSITEQGKKLLDKESFEEKLLNDLPLELSKLKPEEKFAYDNLKNRRNIIKTEIVKHRTISLTARGKELLKQKFDEKDVIEKLTSSMIKDGSWKGKTFRAYDIKATVPKLFAGKRQPYLIFLNDIRSRLLALGFKEMKGPLIETEFYNFDVLFQPQNHPARTWTDTYHLKNPVYGNLPKKNVVNAVKNAHENGANTGSNGWGYKWDPKIASQLMPRAHGTAISGRTIANGIEVPGKYFAIARCYRPDVLDATHLIEFNQMEGFVADDSINFKTLLGILKQFAIEVAGAEKVKFYPDYYPFTEPSVQMSAKHPELGWVEFGGAGLFRPEMVEPLGVNVPVMAWGLGIDRLAMFKLGINDIRYLFSSDLKWLREMGVV
ncbi:phenylalanine--tRNA ligase subunit alpha [Candidatus Woesearchaeota archaeon]|nr:MAG: phenylalanine--tRNA ligase subunit alpha [Candidatus Woesearchaeota archaeon]